MDHPSRSPEPTPTRGDTPSAVLERIHKNFVGILDPDPLKKVSPGGIIEDVRVLNQMRVGPAFRSHKVILEPQVASALKLLGEEPQISSTLLDKYQESRRRKDTKKIKEYQEIARIIGVPLPKKADQPLRRTLLKAALGTTASALTLGLGANAMGVEGFFITPDNSPKPSSPPTEAKKEPSPSPAVAASPITEASPKPAPSPSPEKPKPPEQETFYQELLKPLLDAIKLSRAEKEKNDPEYLKRIDPELNKDRINIVLYSHGIALDASNGEQQDIGSFTTFSIDTKTGRVDTVSWTHDLRAPEIEKTLISQGVENPEPQKIVHAYEVGGTELVGKITEDLTGLSADLVLAFPEDEAAELVDNIFGPLNIEVPKDFDVHAYYYQGKRYDGDHFAKGPMMMDGAKIVEYIKAEAVMDEDPVIINSNRKNKVFGVMGKQAALNFYNDAFWDKAENFMKDVNQNKKMDSSLGLSVLEDTLHNVRQKLTTWNLISAAGRMAAGQLQPPHMASFTYMVSSNFGDGGLEWAVASNSEAIKQDAEKGLYSGNADKSSVQVPTNANPYSDNLVGDYYPSTRKIVHNSLNS